MRNLKSRVWDKALNKWLENSNSLHCFTDYFLTFDGKIVGVNGVIKTGELSSYSNLEYIDYKKLIEGEDKDSVIIKSEDRFEIQQFTGLHDKNGKEIYEGDIISNGEISKAVEFYHGSYGINLKYDKDYCEEKQLWATFHSFYNFISFNINKNKLNWIVIGNICENSELI